MGIDPAYVLDSMEQYEVDALIENRHLRHREQWEQARLEAFIAAKCAGMKAERLADFIRFPWEKAGEDAADIEVTAEDVQRLTAQAAAWEAAMKENATTE